MSIERQLELCSQHYNKWKNIALTNTDIDETKKAMKKAFFWIELRTAFMALHAVEQAKGQDSDVKQKLIVAKAHLSKKLAEYAQEILNEIIV